MLYSPHVCFIIKIFVIYNTRDPPRLLFVVLRLNSISLFVQSKTNSQGSNLGH